MKCELAAVSQLGKDPLLFAVFSVEEEEKVVALVLIGQRLTNLNDSMLCLQGSLERCTKGA